MTMKPEDNLALKTFLYCPVPGLDVVAGATVLVATAAAEACADGIKDAVREGFYEAVEDFQRSAVAYGDAFVHRQLAPLANSLETLTSAVVNLASNSVDGDAMGKP